MDNKIEVVKEENLESMDMNKYPITTNAYTWTPVMIFVYLLLHALSLMFSTFMILTFHNNVMLGNILHWRIFTIFIDVMAWWGVYIFFTLFLGKIFLILFEVIHKPKEGLFKVDKKDRDYYFYCLRVTVKKYIFWVWNNFAFPWVSNLAFRICKMKADFKSTLFDGWSDVEFIEFGENTMLGQGAVILSSMIIGDSFLIKKVIIGDHVVIGGNAIVAPGTVIGKGTTLGVWATTHIGQVLESNYIYIGRPARKFQSIVDMRKDTKKRVRRVVDTGDREEFNWVR